MSQAPNEPSKAEVWITRTTAILAVLAALSSGRWGASNLRAILEQGKVNDTWAHYQAKSIKEHGANDSAALAEALHADPALVASFRSEAKRLNTEKKDKATEATQYENERNLWVVRSFWFEISFAAIQLGVVICTIATATRSKALWTAAIVLGVLGLGIFARGILLKEATVDNAIVQSTVKGLEGNSK